MIQFKTLPTGYDSVTNPKIYQVVAIHGGISYEFVNCVSVCLIIAWICML